MSKPAISVLMAVHNSADYLPASIDSILNQTFPNFEFILIDDGSDESVQDVIEQYHDRRIRSLRLDENIGLTRCLNIALDIAKADIFARHDGDDIALPERFDNEIIHLVDRVGLVSCWADVIDEDGDIIDDPWANDIRRSAEEVEDLLPQENLILSSGAMFSRRVFQHIGYFDPAVRYAQDYNYWLRLAKDHAIYIVPEVLVQKRVHANSVWATEHTVDWKKMAKERAEDYPRITDWRSL